MSKSLYLYWLISSLLVCPAAEAQDPQINIKKELMITDLSVVNDARADGPDGPWSFGGLMTRMAPSADTAGQFVKNWLDSWRREGITVNSFELDKREDIDAEIIGPWMAKDGVSSFEDWKPNFANAPFRLLAVVYRPDIVRVNKAGDFEHVGEGRFVFGAVDQDGNVRPFTAIFEYGLVGTDRADMKAWAERWHALGSLEFGEDYNAALQQITDLFSGRDSNPSKPTGNALNQLRTNEIALGGPWQLREFRISENKKLENATVAQTPHNSLIDTNPATISALVNENAAAIKAGEFMVPEEFKGAPLIGGTSEAPGGFFWPRLQIVDNDARHAFSMTTCNGCHHVESGPKPINFLHIGGRAKDEEAALSVFLTGGDLVADPVDTSIKRSFNDLAGRQKALVEALNPRDSILARSMSADDLSVAASRRSRPH